MSSHDQKHHPDYFYFKRSASQPADLKDPALAKSAALALYLHNILSIEQLQNMFDEHPQWCTA